MSLEELLVCCLCRIV